MNIVVCVKAVPNMVGLVKLKENARDIVKSDMLYKINDTDDNALEEAVRLKEKIGGKVTVITVSSGEDGENARQILWECYAKGADHAIHLVDKLFTGIDSFTTAKLLAEAIKHIPFDLILTGSQALDDNFGHVGPMLAEFLGIPYVTFVVKMDISDKDKEILAWMELDGGFKKVIKPRLPGLITVQSGINEPRYASVSRIMMARSKPIETINADGLGVSEELISSWRKFKIESLSVVEGKKTMFISGNLEETSLTLAKLISDIIGE